MICALTNLRHLDLDLCSKASGLQHMAGTAVRQGAVNTPATRIRAVL